MVRLEARAVQLTTTRAHCWAGHRGCGSEGTSGACVAVSSAARPRSQSPLPRAASLICPWQRRQEPARPNAFMLPGEQDPRISSALSASAAITHSLRPILTSPYSTSPYSHMDASVACCETRSVAARAWCSSQLLSHVRM
jgi:hypothetical protein